MRINYRSYKTAKRAVMRHLRETNLREIVGSLDRWQCVYCGRQKKKHDTVRWTIEHLQPVSRIIYMQTHQINDICNVAFACMRCNNALGAVGPEEKILRFGRFTGSPKRASDVLPEEYLTFDAKLFDSMVVTRVS